MDMVNITPGTAGITAILGLAAVFFGLILLMAVIILMSKYFIAKSAKITPAPAADVPVPLEVKKPEAAGTAGELKLYDTDAADAAMIIAIVADSLGKPLNQLRFISIKEVKE